LRAQKQAAASFGEKLINTSERPVSLDTENIKRGEKQTAHSFGENSEHRWNQLVMVMVPK